MFSTSSDSTPAITGSVQADAIQRLMAEVQKGFDSAKQYGWVSEEDAYRLLKISKGNS